MSTGEKSFSDWMESMLGDDPEYFRELQDAMVQRLESSIKHSKEGPATLTISYDFDRKEPAWP